MSAAVKCMQLTDIRGALIAKEIPKKSTYVVGFMFSPTGKQVVLIRKNKPAWQSGLFNGVGGKIEALETGYSAMAREFEEETGVHTYYGNWIKYGVMSGVDWECELFYNFSELFEEVKTTTSEPVRILDTREVLSGYVMTISNLPWLIEMALDDKFGKNKGHIFATVEYR